METTDETYPPPATRANDNTSVLPESERQAQMLQLFQSELELVGIIASRIARAIGSFVDRDELMAAGREGLFDAARRFDVSRGVPFRAYANIRVQGAIMDFVRQSTRLPRRAHERLKAMDAATNTSAGQAEFVFSDACRTTPLCDLEDRFLDHVDTLVTSAATAVSTCGGATEPAQGESELATSPEEATARAQMVELVRSAMSTLAADELKIVQMYYFEDKSLRESAKELKVTQSWAVRLHARALERLTKQMRSLQ